MRILKFWVALCLFLGLGTAVAGAPVWTFTPLTPTQIAVAKGATATVDYQLTLQVATPKQLYMRPITGITQITSGTGVCGNPIVLQNHGSCTLRLEVSGDALTRPIIGGPTVCDGGSAFLCFTPATEDVLRITQASVPPPTVTAVSPVEGPASGGSGVTITGTDFSGTSTVTFRGIAATSVNVVDDTTITAVTPPHTTGAVDVVVTDSGGSGRLSDGFTYLTTTVGQPAFGGVVACLNGGLNNLIAATADSGVLQWGTSFKNTDALSNEDGAENTAKIVATFGAGSYAAYVCATYEIDSQGNSPCESGNTCYNNWFLPAGNNTTSTGQLNCLYTNQVAIGNFTTGDYLSSTADTSDPEDVIWEQRFSDGVEQQEDIISSGAVRCVHAFTP